MHPFSLLSTIASLCNLAASSAVPFSDYILAPSSRTVYPSAVYKVNGTVQNAEALTEQTNGVASFQGVSSVTLDFGKNIAGVVSITVNSASASNAVIYLTFSESSLWINGNASDATADAGLDEPLALAVGNGPGTYTVDREHERGGFRYLSLTSNTSATIQLTAVSADFTAAPLQDLRAYTGYFHSNDELLNRIWYAGAYTNQLCTIDPTHGNSLVHFGTINSTDNISLPQTNTWYYNYTVTNGSSATVDGAKRDRLVWPGDLAISLPAIVVSTNDLYTVQNSLASLFILQEPNGRLPYAGVPFSEANITSFTYHLYNLIAVSNFYQYSGDVTWLSSYWDQFKRGLDWSLEYVDSSGLMNVTSSADWLRIGMGGHNIEANAILYYTINEGIALAKVLNDTAVITNWTSFATQIKIAANQLLWDADTGLYRDNETTTLHPQDGNAFAIRANLTQSVAQVANISSALHARWGKYGAPAPEAGSPLTISPFIGGFELEAHFLANQPQTSLDLLRLQWGFMLDDPRMTNSSFIEGYSADGSLHYAPYTNDPRVSHAHGWATGPTFLLTFYTAGIHLTSAQGKTWHIAPQLGDLTDVEAGFKTGLGSFGSSVKTNRANGTISQFSFEAPGCTSGDVSLPSVEGTLRSQPDREVKLINGMATGIPGGQWYLELD